MKTDRAPTSASQPGPFRIALVIGGALFSLAFIVSAIAPQFVDEPETAPVGAELLPDLIAAPLIELSAGRTREGRELLFFSAEIANVGDGDFLIRAIRSGTGPWRIRQRIPHATSDYSRVDIPSRLEFAGDNHDHWHVYRAAQYELLDVGREAARDSKVGFCFFDNLHYQPANPGSPAKPVFGKETCNGRDATALSMGLSVGWSDRYIWTLPGQDLDITGVAPGRYVLEMTVDPDRWFRESSRNNNKSWVEIELGRQADGLPTVEVISSGPEN